MAPSHPRSLAARRGWWVLFPLAMVTTVAPATGATPTDSTRVTPSTGRDSSAADSAHSSHRVVVTLPATEVTAQLPDLNSSQTVHAIQRAAMRTLPVDGFADIVALQPGVVVQGDELHVRGGRAGDTNTMLDGFGVNEALRHHAMELPLLGLRSAELVSGAPEAQYTSGLAGVIDVRSVDPGTKPSLSWRWQTALEDRWYDRWSGLVATPLGIAGLGVAAAVDATFDDTWMPDLRTEEHTHVLGVPFLWRADNHANGWVKLAPVAHPQAYSAQFLVNRRLLRPYDPAWSTVIVQDPVGTPGQPGYSPGGVSYNAADHLVITDERQTAVILTASSTSPTRRLSAVAGWLRTRTITSLDGGTDNSYIFNSPSYAPDSFYVVGGNDPIFRQSGSDVLSGRADVEHTTPHGNTIRAGAGASYEDATLREIDLQFPGLPMDAVRAYHAYAPGGFAYTQGRWISGGLVLNGGLRADYWTPGPQAANQTLAWDGHGTLSVSPRLGIAYPISDRDAFSGAYVRMSQAPDRDFLYDNRQAITNRQPMGNPNLTPSEMISYEAVVKHAFDAEWALQCAVYYRDIYGQVGVRNFSHPGLPDQVEYASEDDGHAGGFEITFSHVSGPRRRLEIQYTYLQAWGRESRPEGDPYVPVLQPVLVPLSPTPLSWDRNHSLAFSFATPLSDHLFVSWSTIVGSALPWTPRPIRQPLLDPGLINSRRFEWSEITNFNLLWTPSFTHGLTVGLEARNMFDQRGDQLAGVNGYPNPIINTVYDDYGAYRTDTGQGGGAFWRSGTSGTGYWTPVHDPRLETPPRTLRVSVGADW
jgi:TonB-dependent Receptor Plug Domain